MSYLSRIREIRAAFRGWLRLIAIAIAYKWLPLKGRDLAVKTREAGPLVVPMRRNAGALYTVFEVFAFESWGEALDSLPPAPRILDIGANVGSFTRLAAAKSPNATGLAFEPDPEAFEYLSKNARPTGFEVRESAVGATTGDAVLFRTGAGDGISSLIEESAPGTLVDQTRVRTIAIAEVLGAETGAVDLMKIDCEGAEYEILDVGDASLWSGVQRLALEYHPIPGRSLDGLIERLSELGFTVDENVVFGVGLGMLWASRAK